MKTSTKWLIGGGIVVALGAVAFFTRKYWMPSDSESESKKKDTKKEPKKQEPKKEEVKKNQLPVSDAIKKIKDAYAMYFASQPIGKPVPPTDIVAWAKGKGIDITADEFAEYEKYRKKMASMKTKAPKGNIS